MKTKLEQEVLDSMSKDLGNWHGPFYSNRRDPRLVVPKYDPTLGWTLNFASPYVYVVTICILLIVIAAQVFL